jgi:flavin-dependent dehydrogenase
MESNSYFGLLIYWCSTMLELDIIIVGAGISGLASAIALSRAGHNVQVSTVGSQIVPNNCKAIDQMSFRF